MVGLEVEFNKSVPKAKSQDLPPLKDEVIDVPIPETTFPPDLRTDSLHDFDKVLNWSTQQDSGELPGTGDDALETLAAP